MGGDFFPGLARHSRLAAVTAVVLLLLFSAQVRPPTFSGSIADQISVNNSQLRFADQIAAAGGNREMIIVLLAVDATDEHTESPVTIQDAFRALAALQDALLGAGLDTSVRSVDELSDRLFLYGLTPDDALAELLAVLRDDEMGRTLVGRDGSTFIVAVTVPISNEKRALAQIRSHAFGFGLRHVATLSAGALEQDVAAGLRQDLRRLIPSIVFVMLGILLLAFGHWRALVLPAFASVASSLVVFSVFSIAAVSINLVTLLALPIVLIVALANSCHFLAKSSTVQAPDGNLDTTVAMTLRRVAVPYLISCGTTAVALASLAFNEIGPIRDLGLLSSVSLLISFLLILLFAPWSLRWHLSAGGRSLHFSRLYRRLSTAVHNARRWVATLLVGAAVLSVLALPSIEVRSDARIFFPDNAEFTRGFRLFEDRFFVFAPLQILLPDKTAGDSSLTALKLAGNIRDTVQSLDGVLSVDLTAAVDGGGFVITATLLNESLAANVIHEVRTLQAGNFPEYDVVISSAQLVYESIDRQAMSSLLGSLSVSVMIIFGVIAVLFRSPLAVLSALLANAIPLFLVFGVVWLVGDPLNLVTAFVFLVALGVIVDDTIHILYHLQHGETLSGSSIEFSVVLSTVMLCAGLVLCQLSDFPTTRQFALYCAIALTAAVSSDLTLLPALLRYRDSLPLKHFSR